MTDWQPTENQLSRAKRSRAILEERMIPMWGDETNCLYVDDDNQVSAQTAQEVAKRAMVLWAVALKADGAPHDECVEIISALDLWTAVSPKEKRFLDDPDPDPEVSQSLVWRLESVWVMLWALDHIDNLPWPADMCDVAKLVETMKPFEANPAFIDEATLLPRSELLDAQDLILKIHWAIRDAWIKGLCIPEDLDWRSDDGVPAQMCAATGIVEQRHHALNWILNFMDPESWDDVDTPT